MRNHREECMKVGVIGAGGMGTVHLGAYAGISGVEVVGVADVRPDAAKAAAERSGTRAYVSYEELVAAEDPELVSVCLPTSQHADIAVRAAREGRHVILEKPIARNLEDARRIVEAFSESSARIFVGHVVRFFSEYARLRRMVKEGRFGEVGVVRASRKVPLLAGSRDWYVDWEASGGVVVDTLVHDFDFLRWTFGEVERVYAKSILGQGYGRLDYALVTLKFRSGTIAHVEGQWGYPGSFWYSIEISGTRALATVDSRKHGAYRILLGEEAKLEEEVLGEPVVEENPFRAEIEHFVRCAEDGDEPLVSAEDAFEALRIGLAALESASTGSPVDLRGSR
jgi:UDP-N-acetylglucosamine 3-dehydrogenase